MEDKQPKTKFTLDGETGCTFTITPKKSSVVSDITKQAINRLTESLQENSFHAFYAKRLVLRNQFVEQVVSLIEGQE